MPIRYLEVKYLCKFKCPIKPSFSRAYIENHEIKCWSNPKNKACRSCAHEIYVHNKLETIRECEVNNINKEEIKTLSKFDDNGKLIFIRPKCNCDKWENKELKFNLDVIGNIHYNPKLLEEK